MRLRQMSLNELEKLEDRHAQGAASSTGLRRARTVLGTQQPLAPQMCCLTTQEYRQGLILSKEHALKQGRPQG